MSTKSNAIISRLEAIFDTIPSAVIIVKEPNKIAYANKRALQLYGLEKTDLVSPDALNRIRPRKSDGTFFPLEELPSWKALHGQEVHNQEVLLQDINGQLFSVLASAAPLRDSDDRIVGTVISFEDISERKKTEETFKHTSQTVSRIIDTLSDGIYEADKNWNLVHVNRRVAVTVGSTPSELIGKNVWTVFSKLVGTYYEEKLREAMAKKEPIGFEWKSLYSDNFWEISVFPTDDGIIVNSRDITERKKIEEALRKTNEQLEATVNERTKQVSRERQRLYDILEALPVYVCLLDEDYLMPFSNKVFRQLFGDSKGKRCYEFLFHNNAPCENCETYKVLKTNKPITWEWTGPNGRAYDIYDFPFVEADGAQLILEMGIDITERKRAEKKLRDALLYARSLIEASLDPLVTISAEGKITDVNKATELVTGCSRQELIGSDFCSYFTQPEKAQAGYMKVFAEGLVRDYPLMIRHKTGKITDVLYNATLFRNETGKIQGVFAAARDVTELNKAEKLAEESLRKLKEAERLAAIGATAGMVGHDIRNPLQAIMGDVYLLKEYLTAIADVETKKEATESLDSIDKNIIYINKIVADLQDYARPLIPERIDVNLPEIVTGVFKAVYIPDNITVLTDTKNVTLKSDPMFIRRSLTNLINNAIQAMPNGGKLSVIINETQSAVLITVEDTGIGISEEVKPKLFTPMITTKSKGQGLGLAVVKRLVEALNGKITFESQAGKGTKFTVELPKAQ